jgi:hypothetical protein
MSNVLEPVQCINVADGATNITSSQVIIKYIKAVSFEVATTGTLVGSVQLQISNTGAHWTTYGNPVPLESPPEVQMIECPSVASQRIRVVWTFGSGAGALVITASGKE